MKVTIGKAGLTKTWQADFPETTKCCRCKGEARIGFVVHEGLHLNDELYTRNGFERQRVYALHKNEGKGNLWLHDCCAVAVYFCKDCLETTALYNQG